MKKSICIIGLGYIGLPTASILATKGHQIIGVDVNDNIINCVKEGHSPVCEPDLDLLIKAAVNSGNLTVHKTPSPADAFIICVPTPFLDNKEADLSFVEKAGESILPYLKKGDLVILESTVPPGTTAGLLAKVIAKSGLKVGEDIHVAFCPERVLPGRILIELVSNDRVVGGINPASAEKAREIYSSFVEGNIFLTDATTAEMSKLVENSYRDVNIAFANELRKICDFMGIDVWEVISLANRHPRVNILNPGPGVGGHCIAVDPWFIVQINPALTPLITAARNVNDSMPDYITGLINNRFKQEKPGDVTIAILGLTYKADVDDLRESPALNITRKLIAQGYNVKINEPHARIEKMGFSSTPLETIFNKAQAVILLVNHSIYKTINTESLLKQNPNCFILDTRGIWKK